MKREMKRSSGILMPIFSLPSPWGIGTMGEAAFSFVEFLVLENERRGSRFCSGQKDSGSHKRDRPQLLK
ncbi:MAG: hypothetical protein MJ116_09510 [Lachnospiraceae bacterium]|nr:hypothetical protein [Lachnospiraceae bacterium]